MVCRYCLQQQGYLHGDNDHEKQQIQIKESDMVRPHHSLLTFLDDLTYIIVDRLPPLEYLFKQHLFCIRLWIEVDA